jgi:hypothetical protein
MLSSSGCSVLYGSGCRRCEVAYHPLQGLHDPVVVDPTQRNFEGLQLLVHCPAQPLQAGDAERLCRRATDLFENQGATVSSVTSDTVRPDPFAGTDEEQPRPDLTLQLRSRREPPSNQTLNLALAVVTFTFVPIVREEIFAIDLAVRDREGFLLLEDTLRGRIVQRVGLGAILVNGAVDQLFRPRDQRHNAENAEKELSADVYGQLSQRLFNAQVRARMILAAPPVAP